MQVQIHSKIHQGWFLRKSLYVARCLHPMQIPLKEQWLQGVLFHFKVMTVYIISHCTSWFYWNTKTWQKFFFSLHEETLGTLVLGKTQNKQQVHLKSRSEPPLSSQREPWNSYAYERTSWKSSTPWYLNCPWPKKKNGKNVLLLIWMQSTCKYYIKGKVKMVVILPEFLDCTDVEK